MKALRLMLIVLACSIASFTQNPILVTKDNWQALHSRVKLEPDTLSATSSVTPPDPNKIQIGLFYAIMWPDGQAQYEFDWSDPFHSGPLGCPPECKYYGSKLISFSNIIVNVDGGSFPSGPFNESDGLGLAWFAGPGDIPNLSACQPMTQMFARSLVSYRTNCIDVALQLIFPSSHYTFTLLNGQTFTTRKVETDFIVPSVGHTELYSYCEPGGVFCKGQVIPVYVQRIAD
jgi:hypothetical protein